MTMGAAKTPSGAECDRIAPDVRARALLAGFSSIGAGHRTWCGTDRLPEARIWTCGRAAHIYFERSSEPDGEGDERLRSVLPGRQGRRSLRRALDAACAARIAVRQHAFQRSSPRRSADVAKLAQPAIEAARADWGGRAQARAARTAISPHPGGAGLRARRPPAGRRLGEWGQRWFRSRYVRDELDVSLLMWDMRRCIKVDAFPAGRTCVQFDFSDLPASKRTWWLVCDGEEVDLCPANPGFEVGLYVATDLRTMTRVFMGDLALKSAIASAQIELDGPRELRQRFERWLGLSGFAHIGDPRRPPPAPPNRHRPHPPPPL